MNYDKKAILREALRKGAVTVGYGYKEVGGELTTTPSIKFGVPQKLPPTVSMQSLFAKSYDGTPSDVYQTEIPRALEVTGKYRPVPGGCSAGHYAISAGTIGCWVKKGDELYALSNNHVFANSNDAKIGDDILQPGPHDDGIRPDDVFATLDDFIPLHFNDELSSCKFSNATAKTLNKTWKATGRKTRFQAVVPQADFNLVDAAIAKPTAYQHVDETILGLGPPTGVAEGLLGVTVKKHGRTTGLTTGVISQVDVVSQVMYDNQIAVFEDQLIVTGQESFSAGGDSGSAVLDPNLALVGLLFAGSSTVTIVNRIQNVFSLLGVSL